MEAIAMAAMVVGTIHGREMTAAGMVQATVMATGASHTATQAEIEAAATATPSWTRL